jgi:tyrosine-protein phosphatase SIW14
MLNHTRHRASTSFRLGALFIWLGVLCTAAELPVIHVRNFDRVNDHLYRGGVPTPVGLQEIGALGVKTVIDLREAGEGTEFEKEQVQKLGMRYINIPFRPFSAPTQEQIQRVLALLLHGGDDPIFLHCRRGKDRTGTVIACYRIQHDTWNNHQALSEAKQHGMSMTERGMQSYILHFSPLSLSLPGATLSK